LTRPGDVVLTEALNYSGVRRLADLCRVTLIGIPVDTEGLRANAIADACARHAPKVILTTPVTLNPTTATQDLRRRKALIAVAQRYSMMIIEDDIYGHLAGDATPPLAALWPDGVVHVTSLSKCVAPGVRVGYVAAKERLISRLLDALLSLSWTAGSLHTAVANELIGSGAARACAAAHRTEALNRLALARRILGQPVAAGPAATYHGWLRLPAAWSERDAAAAFQRHGIIVSPAHHFVIGEQAAPAAVRLSLGAIADQASLELALGTMASVLDSREVGVSGIV
jgi:DNA-binding transcriptional MocR family regulator